MQAKSPLPLWQTEVSASSATVLNTNDEEAAAEVEVDAAIESDLELNPMPGPIGPETDDSVPPSPVRHGVAVLQARSAPHLTQLELAVSAAAVTKRKTNGRNPAAAVTVSAYPWELSAESSADLLSLEERPRPPTTALERLSGAALLPLVVASWGNGDSYSGEWHWFEEDVTYNVRPSPL
eukprot:SAG11_NODE_782_length_7192_cov_4.178063_4_plen_180_part_00